MPIVYVLQCTLHLCVGYLTLKKTPSLRPTELEVKDVDDDERQRIQQIGHETCPEREIGPEAGEEAHYGADKEDDEDLRREIPRQIPHVNEGQEHGQAECVVHGHRTVDLQLSKHGLSITRGVSENYG